MWDKELLEKQEPVQQQTEKPGDIKPIPLKELHKKKGLKILLYGDTATGKTRFSLSAPGPILFLDTEMGVAPLAPLVKDKEVNVLEIFKLNPETYQLDSIKSLEEVDKAIFYLRNNSGSYGTVIMDSVTSIWQYLQDWLRFEVVEKRGETFKSGNPTLQGVTQVPTDRRDWAAATTRHTNFIYNLMQLDQNFIAVAQSHPVYDDKGNATLNTKPSYQKNMPFLIDIVIKMEKRLNPITKTYKYFGTIEKCRIPVGLEGTVVDDVTFDKVKNLLIEKGAFV